MRPDVIGGRYRVRSVIGHGGMGTVWLCYDEVLNRDVAIKGVGLLPGEDTTDTARAFREARSSAALSHRNVVTVFDVVEENDAIWLVMEYVPSRSLSEIIREDGPLPPAEVAAIGAQVADGLAAAHAAGTTHRDVKPGNVFVREDGVAKIGDFGIARHVSEEPLTQSGFMSGTPSYFSPELARGGDPGPASDVWALGATLYAAVEGRPPYAVQSNPVAALHEIVSNPPPRPERAEFLDPVLSRMLDRDPETRWSADDAAHALHRLARQHASDVTQTPTLAATAVAGAAYADDGVSARADTPVRAAAQAPSGVRPTAPPPAPTQEDPGRRRSLVPWLVALAVVLVVGVGYLLLRPDGTDPSAGNTSVKDPPSPKASASKSQAPEESGTPDPTTSKTPPRTTPSETSAPPAGNPQAMVDAVTTYFTLVPDDLDAGWAAIGPELRAQGRASYDSFWNGIESVEVSDVRASGADTVDATVTYTPKDGVVSTEQKRFTMIERDGEYLINTDEPAG